MSIYEDVYDATHTLCDKCGRPVPPNNDMVWVMFATGLPGTEWVPTLWHSRHFLPVVGKDGSVICEGSPSRAQYIEGQPRDKRGYGYDPGMEPIYREALATLKARSSTD